MSGLLAGVRVLESAVLFNGDYVGMLLGDLGADVIKVEAPGQGDYIRDFLGQITPHHSPAHIQVNRNKRSITLDLRRDEGRDVFWRLLDTTDVFVDGNAADATTRLGIGYEAQRRVKPDIVYCQHTGYGAEGPYAAIPTHGQMMNALAGATPVRMNDDGFVRPVPVADPCGGPSSGGDGPSAGGVHAAMLVAAALVRRDRTGQGCYLDVSAAEGVLAAGWLGTVLALNADRLSTLPGPVDLLTGSPWERFYETADGRFVFLSCVDEDHRLSFCQAAGRPDLASGEDSAAVEELLRRRTQAEWVALATAHRFPLVPAHAGDADLGGDPHLLGREVIVDGEHPHAGPFTYVGSAATVAGSPFQVRRPAPRLGEHTDEVLTEIGFGPHEIGRWRSEGIL